MLRIEGLEQVAEDRPPPYDPQSNGAIESAVKSTKGKLRTIVLGLEARIRHRIPPDHPIISWIVQHTTFLMNRQIKGPDGRTGYERVRSRAYSTRLLEIGEYCRYKLRSHDVLEDGSTAARWSKGICLGMDPRDNTYMFFD